MKLLIILSGFLIYRSITDAYPQKNFKRLIVDLIGFTVGVVVGVNL